MYTLFTGLAVCVVCSIVVAENITDTGTTSTNTTKASAETTKIPAVTETPVVVKNAPDVLHKVADEPQFVAEANSSILLACPLAGGAIIQWFKEGSDTVIKSEEKTYTVFPENSSLLVHKVGPDYSGFYKCNSTTATKAITLGAIPYVFHPDKKMKNVIEDDPFVMECKAWGFPAVTLVWMRDGEPIVPDDRIIFKDGYSANSTLRITRTVFEDAARYECMAVNEHGNGTVYMDMNVKDKLAALWPFLGICGEVIILCTIIFVYEKRRTKRLAAEERRQEEETDRLNGTTDTKVPDELRQRKN